jgi:hypothetical protein
VEFAAGTLQIHLKAEALVDLADVLEATGYAEAAESTLHEAVRLFEQKGDVVSTARLQERLGASATVG